MAQSDSVWTLPYVNNFNTQENGDDRTTTDTDGDDFIRAFDRKRIAINSNGSWGTPDDWLFTPEMTWKAQRICPTGGAVSRAISAASAS